MHIVILSDYLPPEATGGAGRVAWQLGQGLLAAGHRVTFVASTPGKARVETRQGFTVHLLHSHYAARWQAWFGLVNPQTLRPLNVLLRRLKPDVVSAHDVRRHLGYHSLVVARYAGAVSAFHAHNALPFAYGDYTAFIEARHREACDHVSYRLPFAYNLRRVGLRWNPARNLSIRHTMRYHADVRIAVSLVLKQALEANRLAPFEVVHNGIHLASFDVQPGLVELLRQRLRLDERRVILFGARLRPEKGGDQLLAALRQVRRAVPNVALLVLAPAPEDTQHLVDRHPELRDHIVPGGWLEGAELAAAYRLAHVVATPSVYLDPLPAANLEGMAAGAVPVTSCYGGGREAVTDGETGYVVNPHDTDALADRLSRLLTDEELRQRMARAGRQRVEQHFTIEQQTARTLAVYERALVKRRS